MSRISISQGDLNQHVVTFGIDVYPPIEIPVERTRLNMFFEEAHARWPEHFVELTASDNEFRISRVFHGTRLISGKAGFPVHVFELTPRGPIVRFPLLLPKPVGKTDLETTAGNLFDEIRQLFFGQLPGRKILRVGLVRDAIFETGKERCDSFLGAMNDFAGAELQGGSCRYSYRDSLCNIHLQFNPVQAVSVTQLPIGGAVSEPEGFGLHVQLDVNNADLKTLSEPEIAQVIERANSLWPNNVLEFIKGREAS